MAGTTGSPQDRQNALPLIGGQLSSAGGWSQIPPRALAAGAEVVQVFSSNPRIWPTAPPDADALIKFCATLRRHGLPLFMHAVYLINPASPDQGLRERSIAALTHSLTTGALAGADGVVTHLGSHRGEGFDNAALWVTESLTTAWAEAERQVPMLRDAAAAGAAHRATRLRPACAPSGDRRGLRGHSGEHPRRAADLARDVAGDCYGRRRGGRAHDAFRARRPRRRAAVRPLLGHRPHVRRRICRAPGRRTRCASRRAPAPRAATPRGPYPSQRLGVAVRFEARSPRKPWRRRARLQRFGARGNASGFHPCTLRARGARVRGPRPRPRRDQPCEENAAGGSKPASPA